MSSLNVFIEALSFPSTCRPPHQYTGELFGVEHLHQKTGLSLHNKNLDTQIDEGFGDFEWSDKVSMLPVNVDEVNESTVSKPEDSDNDSDSGEKEEVYSYISKMLSLIIF